MKLVSRRVEKIMFQRLLCNNDQLKKCKVRKCDVLSCAYVDAML